MNQAMQNQSMQAQALRQGPAGPAGPAGPEDPNNPRAQPNRRPASPQVMQQLLQGAPPRG